MSKSKHTTDLAEVVDGFGGELATCDVAAGVVNHLKVRTMQYQEVDRVSLFGIDPESVESRTPRKGDHPLLQILKREASVYADSLMAEAKLEEMDNVGNMVGRDDVEKKIMPPRVMAGAMKRIMEASLQLAKLADTHFAREIQMWMEHSKKIKVNEMSIEDAAKTLSRQMNVPFNVAMSILQSGALDDAA